MEYNRLPLGRVGRGLAIAILCCGPSAGAWAQGSAPSTTAPAPLAEPATGGGASGMSSEEQTQWNDIQAAVDAHQYRRAEQQLNDWINTHPDDRRAHYLRGYVLMFEEKIARSINEFDILLGEDPNNADYLLGKAKALVRGGRYGEAIPILDQLRAMAPTVPLIYGLEAEALTNTGDTAKLNDLKADAARNGVAWDTVVTPAPVVTPGRGGNATTSYPVQLSLGATYDFLNNGFSNWQTYFLSGSKYFGLHNSIYGSVERTRRFNLDDTGLALGRLFPITNSWFGRVEATGSPTHNILEKFSVLGEVGKSVGNGLSLSVGERHVEYTSERTDVQFGTIAKSFGGHYYASYTLGVNEAPGPTTALNHAIQLYDYYGSSNQNVIGLGTTFGQTTINLGLPGANVATQRVVTAGVFDIDLTGTHWLLPDWGVDYGLGYERLNGLYDRESVTLAARYAIR